MKLEPARCPKCGDVAALMSESVSVNAELIYNETADEYDYAGGSQVIWDTQESVVDAAGRVEVQCPEGHLWAPRVLTAAEPRKEAS